MQQYNTCLKQIKLPEYGRNIQSLIDYCKTIPDRDKRTRYAYGIVDFMSRVSHDDNPAESDDHIFWDHLALLSNFELDVDYPYEIIKKENLNSKPEPVLFNSQNIRYKMYGKVVELLIAKARRMEDPEQRLRLFERCANHMKLQYHITNRDTDEDNDKIIHDLIDYAGPAFAEECRNVSLYSLAELKENYQYETTAAATPKKKKKKKKKAAK